MLNSTSKLKYSMNRKRLQGYDSSRIKTTGNIKGGMPAKTDKALRTTSPKSLKKTPLTYKMA